MAVLKQIHNHSKTVRRSRTTLKWVGFVLLDLLAQQSGDLITILPGALLLSSIASRLKNTTPEIVYHQSINGLPLVATEIGILGLTL